MSHPGCFIITFPKMASGGSQSTFEFINVSNTGAPQDAKTRTIRRRQAMSNAAAARRQKGNYGKTNLRQYPIFVGQEDGPSRAEPDPAPSPSAILRESGSTSTALEQNVENIHFRGGHAADYAADDEFYSSLLQTSTIPPNLASVGYECMRIQYDSDILDLSALTCFHTCRATSYALLRDPTRLVEVLRCKQWSYLSFLPSRVGHVECLDDAVRCLAARARQQLSSPSSSPNGLVLSLYSKALSSLQTALEGSDSCREPEVLCATQILAIFEVGSVPALSI